MTDPSRNEGEYASREGRGKLPGCVGSARGSLRVERVWVLMNSRRERTSLARGGWTSTDDEMGKSVTWLILPVVICLSQRLSHSCLSINEFVL